MSNYRVEVSLPCGGNVDFLEKSRLSDGLDANKTAPESSKLASNVAQRSRSAVNVQVEGNSADDRFDLHSSSLMSRSLRGKWSHASNYATPMGDVLSSQLTYVERHGDDSYHSDQNLQSKLRRVGPEQFLEMLKKKKSLELVLSAGRRRTLSENQTSSATKLLATSRSKVTSELQRPQVTRHWSYDSPAPRSFSGSAFCINKSFEGKVRGGLHEDHMMNFPKVNVGSPKSPLNEIFHFTSSPSEHLVIWKEPYKEDRIIKLSSMDDDGFEEVDKEICLERMIDNILRLHTAYNAMPQHSRCIVLDLRLKVGSAFDALAYDGIHAAPLWDDTTRSFVGMLTMTDFVHILQQYLDQPEVLSMVRDDRVSKWRDHLLHSGQISFPCGDALTTSVNSTLEEMLDHLLSNKVHRVIVTDPETNNALYIATFRQILKYLWQKVTPVGGVQTRVMNKSIEELVVGSYGNLVSVSLLTPVSEIFSVLLGCRLSAIPVVDEDFRVVDIFRKADVMSLILDGSFNDLYCPVRDVLDYERSGFEGLYKCRKTDSVYDVISLFVAHGLHRMVVVDEDGRLEGVVTLSDIVRFLLDPERMGLVGVDRLTL